MDSAGDFQRQVPMRLVRREWADLGATPTTTDFQIEGALWSMRAGTHFLTYHLPSDDAQGEPDRTTLKLEGDRLTLIRFGRVRWRHQFEPGADRASYLDAEGLRLPVRILTEAVVSRITQRGGYLRLKYAMNMGGTSSSVELQMGFGEGVFSDEDAASTI